MVARAVVSWLASVDSSVTSVNIEVQRSQRGRGIGTALLARMERIARESGRATVYERISEWVAPGGTLLIIGHLRHPSSTGHGHHPPAEATVTLADIARSLDPALWSIKSAEGITRTLLGSGGRAIPLHDVVVRATRHSRPRLR
jgi:Acetyltransferase (GNAT) family